MKSVRAKKSQKNKKSTIWFCYMIEAANGKIYTGIAKDPKKRFAMHENGKGARFFRLSTPKKILWLEKHKDRSSASKRECAIKKLDRKSKLALILTEG